MIYNYVDFTMPAPFSLDTGYDHMANMDNYKLGLTSLCGLSETMGIDADRVMEERAVETVQLLDYVEKIHSKYKDVPKETILNLLSQRGQSSFSVVAPQTEEIDTKQ